MEQLRELAKELGQPGTDKLWKEARRRSLQITRQEVAAYVLVVVVVVEQVVRADGKVGHEALLVGQHHRQKRIKVMSSNDTQWTDRRAFQFAT